MHRSGKRVFDRHHAARRLSRFHRAKQIRERGARDEPELPAVSLECRGVTERSRFALDCDCPPLDRKSTRLNSSHGYISYAVFCLKKKKRSRSETPARTPYNAARCARTPSS